MPTLASCIKKRGDLLAEADRKDLEKVAKKYIQDGYKPDLANVSAVEDAITDLELEHKNVIAQVKDLGGAELAKMAQDQFSWEPTVAEAKKAEKVKPEPKEPKVEAKKELYQLSEGTKKGKPGNMLLRGKDGTVYESKAPIHALAMDEFDLDPDEVVDLGITTDTGHAWRGYGTERVKKQLQKTEAFKKAATDQSRKEIEKERRRMALDTLRVSVPLQLESIKTVDDLLDQARATYEQTAAFVKMLADKLGGEAKARPDFMKDKGEKHPLKRRSRIEQKVKLECDHGYKEVTDVIGHTVLFDDLKSLLKAVEWMKNEFMADRLEMKIGAFRDRYANTGVDGYRDVLMKLRAPNGHVWELQMNTKLMADAKEPGIGHYIYNVARDLTEGIKNGETEEIRKEALDRQSELSGIQRKLYDRVYEVLSKAEKADAISIASSSDIMEPLSEILAKVSTSDISRFVLPESLNSLLDAVSKAYGLQSYSKYFNALKGKPSVSSAIKITPEEEKIKRNEPPPAGFPANITPGMKVKVYTASQMEGIPVHYGLIEASEVIPSHDPMTFAKRSDYPENVQEREYHVDKHEQAKVIDHARNLKTPLLLTNNPDAVNGPPIIMQNGIVLGGNSRAMSLMRAYEDGPMGVKYKTKLALFAEQFGLTSAQVEAMKNPILVRVTDQVTDNPKELHKLATVFNESMTQAMSTEAKMVSMGKNVSPSTVQRIGMMMAEADETIRGLLDNKKYALSILDMLHADGIITKAQLNKYWNEKRNIINENGKALVEGVLLGNVVDDADLLRDTPPFIMQKVSRSLADLSKIRGRGGDWDILGHLKLALDLTINALAAKPEKVKFTGSTVDAFLAQTTFINRADYTPKSIVLAKALIEFGPKQWSNSTAGYARDAHLDAPGQGVLLVTFSTPEESFREHFGDPGEEMMAKAAEPPGKYMASPGLFDRQIGEMELDEGTKAFIERKVRKLGSYDRVADFYSRNDIVGKYALALARERYGVERPTTQLPPVIEPSLPTGVREPGPIESGITDFSQGPAWHDIAYRDPTPEVLDRLKKWLKGNPYAIVRMYHGTDASLPIPAQGLKPTSARTAKSLQSRRGVVSLSIFPDMARRFGEMAYPGKEVAVYAVDVPVNRLVPDTDQLKNKRYWGREPGIGATLADSIAYGHGAQVKGPIPPAWIRPAGTQEIQEPKAEYDRGLKDGDVAEPEGPGPRPTDKELEDRNVRPDSLVEYKGMWMGQGTRDWLKDRWKVIGRGFDNWYDTQDKAVEETLKYEKRQAEDKEYFERQKKAMEYAMAKQGRITEKEAVAALGDRLFGMKQGADIIRSVAGIPLSKAKEVMASLSFARVTKNGVTLWHSDVILNRAKELWMMNKERAARGERPLGAKKPVQAGLFGEGGKPAFELTPSESTTEERIAMAKQRGEAVTPAVERKRAVIPEGEIKAATGGPQRALFAEMEKQTSLFKEAAALYSFKPMDAGMIVENAEADTRPPATWADGWSDPGPRDIAFEPVAEGQLDLLKWTEIEASLGVEPAKAEAAEKPAYRAQTVKVQTTGNIKAQSLHIKTDGDVASLLSALRKKPQEEMIMVLTDENNTLLEVFRHTKGIIGGAVLHLPDLVGRAVNVGAKNAWLVHNHPSRRADFSPEDASFLTSSSGYFQGAGIKTKGLVIAGKKFVSWNAGNLTPTAMVIKPVLRKLSFPIKERAKLQIKAEHGIIAPDNFESIVTVWSGGTDGALITDRLLRPVAFMPAIQGMPYGEYTGKLLGLIEQVNGGNIFFYVKDKEKTPGIFDYMASAYKLGDIAGIPVTDLLMGKNTATSLSLPRYGTRNLTGGRITDRTARLRGMPAPYISRGPEQPYRLTKRDIIHAKAVADLIPVWLKKAGATPEILKRITWELKPFVDLRDADIEKTLKEWNLAGVEVKDVGAAVTINKMNALVQLSARISNLDDMELTALHEYYHIVRSWLLPPETIRKMDRLFKTEEEQAEAFAHYIKTMKLPSGDMGVFSEGKTSDIGALQRAWQILRRFLQMAANWMRGRGFARPEDVFGQIAVGSFGPDFARPTAAHATMLDVAAYHGSDSVFDRFSTDYIGTGEGGASFGWGLYFTEIEDVAKWYAANAADRKRYQGVSVKGVPMVEEGFVTPGVDSWELFAAMKYYAREMLRQKEEGTGLSLAHQIKETIETKIANHDAYPRMVNAETRSFKHLADYYKANMRDAKPEDFSVKEFKKTLYSVTLAKGKAPSEHEWLKWDGRLTSDQIGKISKQGKIEGRPELASYKEIDDIMTALGDIAMLPAKTHAERKIQLTETHDALRKKLNEYLMTGNAFTSPIFTREGETTFDWRMYDNPSGQRFYEALVGRLGGKKEASLFLKRAGIPGISYPAGSLSGIESDKQNYVVFDDSLVTVEGVTHFRPQDVPSAGERARNMAKANVERLKKIGSMDQKERIKEAEAYFEKFEGWNRDQINTIKEVVQGFKGQKKGWDIERPDTTVLERLLQSAEFYWEKVPAAWRVLQASIKRQDRFHHLYNAITDDDKIISDMKALKHARLDEYNRLSSLIQIADMNQINYTSEQLRGKGFSEQAILAWEGFRKVMDRTLDLLMQDLIALQQRYVDAGKPFPDIVTWEGDKRIQINLNIALARMGRLKGSYAPRRRQPGKWAIIAEKEGANPYLEFRDTVTMANVRAAELEKQGYTVRRTPSNKLPEDVFSVLGKSLGIQSLMNQAMDMVLKQDKLGLEDFGLTGRRLERTIDGQRVSTLVVSGPTSKRMNVALKALGGRFYSWPKRKGAPKAWVFDDAPPAMEARIIKTLAEGASVTEAIETELLFAHAITTEVSNLVKGRGFRSAMIRRSQARGMDVWLGYETDPLRAMSLHVMGVAAGIAKKNTAMDMWRAATGTDIEPEAFKTHEAYLDAVRERRIDPTKQGNIYHDVMRYIDEVLRNQEMNDRVIGIIKGLAVLKYLGFRIASPLVNLTALVTSVPASMHGYGGIAFADSPKYLVKAMDAYFKYLTNKEEQLDPDTKKALDEIHDQGWHNSQFNREAMSVLNGKLEGGYQTAVRYSMFIFGKTEQLNRVSTILGSYMAMRDKQGKAFNREEGMKTAKLISDRSHGVYGKETLPYIAQGHNPAAQAAKMFYIFSKFSHTYLQNMYHLGFKEGDKKALVYMMLAPAVLAGAGAVPILGKPALYVFGKLLGALGAGGAPEGEENVFAWLTNWLGGFMSNMVRHGLLGAGGYGISTKGSLAIDFSQNFPTTLPEFLGAPASAAVDLYDAGGQLLRGNVYRAIEKAAPRVISEPMKIGREYQTGITTERGVPKYLGDELMKPTALDVVYKILNFSPAHYATMKEQKWAETETINFYRDWRSEIYEKARYLYSLPAAQRDDADMASLTAEIHRYNDRVKSRKAYTIKGINLIDQDSIKSAVRLRK